MRAQKSQAGQAMVEFALTALVVIGLFLVLMDGSRVLWQYVQISQLARDGARYATVHSQTSGSPTNATDVTTYVKDKAVSLDKDAIQVLAEWPEGNIMGKWVEVNITYTTSTSMSAFWPGNLTLSAQARMVIQY